MKFSTIAFLFAAGLIGCGNNENNTIQPLVLEIPVHKMPDFPTGIKIGVSTLNDLIALYGQPLEKHEIILSYINPLEKISATWRNPEYKRAGASWRIGGVTLGADGKVMRIWNW